MGFGKRRTVYEEDVDDSDKLKGHWERMAFGFWSFGLIGVPMTLINCNITFPEDAIDRSL
jgi:hypothetical protein